MGTLNLIVGPPGSGKTTRLLEVALKAARAGKRVWWTGLPSQRAYVYTRATRTGAVLGLEFLSSQQVYYRLLAAALKLKPLLVGTGRMALVGEALKTLYEELPAPGEARLFTRAVAEAKRFGLTPDTLPASDPEGVRLREVFRAYERLKGERWDYDDFRREAFAAASRTEVKPDADVVIVDGFRELGPLELGLYRALSETVEVWLSLPEVPPGFSATETLLEGPSPHTEVFRAANPVAEARWVLRSLKRDLAGGGDPLSLAVILPEREVRAFAVLADEFGVPLMDETPRALADSPGGRLLLDLLELPDYPTPSKLLAIPELAPLANLALRRKLAGREAMALLARELGLERPFSLWLGRLETPQDELAWARELLDSLPELTKRPTLSEKGRGWERFKEHALERAKEVAQIARGAQFRAWWGALLQETALFERPRGGVALLTPTLASGRRFRRVYLMRALEGAYSAGEHEDYFVPEEARLELSGMVSVVHEHFGLPKRFLGRDPLLFLELKTRADEVIVTYPEADQGGPRVPELALTGGALPLSVLPAGSPLEAGERLRFTATLTPVALRRVSVGQLSAFDRCGFQFWAGRFVARERVWWRELVSELRGLERLNGARLEALCGTYPDAAPWFGDVASALLPLTFGYTLSGHADGPYAHLDAVGRSGDAYRVYTFVEPGSVTDPEEARRLIEQTGRLHELWAAAQLLGQGAACVHLYVWPVLGRPVAVYEDGVRQTTRTMRSRQAQAARLHARLLTGEVTPKPGFGCRECGVFDLCRAGTR